MFFVTTVVDAQMGRRTSTATIDAPIVDDERMIDDQDGTLLILLLTI